MKLLPSQRLTLVVLCTRCAEVVSTDACCSPSVSSHAEEVAANRVAAITKTKFFIRAQSTANMDKLSGPQQQPGGRWVHQHAVCVSSPAVQAAKQQQGLPGKGLTLFHDFCRVPAPFWPAQSRTLRKSPPAPPPHRYQTLSP